MPPRKRKRAWHTQLASFPDEKPRRNSVAPASLSSAWIHCGDGFQTASSLETKKNSQKPARVEKSLASLLNSAEGISKSESSSEFTDIVWSSSGSDFSDDENKTLTSRFPYLKGEKCGKYDLLSKDIYSEDGPQFIDWENESDYGDDANQCSGTKPDDISLDILDADSSTSSTCASDEKAEDEYSKMMWLEEISGAIQSTRLPCRSHLKVLRTDAIQPLLKTSKEGDSTTLCGTLVHFVMKFFLMFK